MNKNYLLLLVLFLSANSYADQWIQKANFPGIGRELPAGFAIGNKGYIGCGYNFGSGYLRDFWEYNPATNVWAQKASLPGSPRFATVGFSIGNKGYIGTGGSPYLDDFWEYDPSTNIWTQKANTGGGVHYAGFGFSIGTKGYLGGGYTGNDFWEWDQATNVWTQKTSVPVSTVTAVGLSANGKGYFVTGSNNYTYEFDPVLDTWTRKADFPGSSREDAAGFVICGKLYVGTGESPLTNDWYQYNPASNTWIRKKDIPSVPLDDAAAFAIGNVGYFGLGDASSLLNALYAYLPDSVDICGALPTANFKSSDSILCANDCINFTNLCSNAVSYQWFFDGGLPSASTDTNPQVCYLTAGAFNVKLIASNFYGSDSATFNNYIGVQNSPVAPYINQNGATLYFTHDTDYTSYQWYDSTLLISGATDTFLVVSHSGNYNLEVTNKNGCKVSVGINIVLGMPDYLSDNAISLYPNPVTSKLQLATGNWQTGDPHPQVYIYNILGEIILQPLLFWRATEGEADVSMLPAGIYFLQITGEKERWLGRFVKQ